MLQRADAETQDARRAICAACPHLVRAVGARFCGKCGCAIAAKTKFAGESCPAGKWSPSTGAKQ